MTIDATEVEYTKGDIVVTDAVLETSNYYHFMIPGWQYTISRVYKNKVEIRGDFANSRAAAVNLAGTDPDAADRSPIYTNRTVSVYKSEIRPFDGPIPRKLGEVPEGDFIAPTDPRIAWFFEDAAKIATRNGYCGYYDTLANELNFPGRERSYTVTTEVNGIKVQARVKARTRKQAEELVTEKLGHPATGAEPADD